MFFILCNRSQGAVIRGRKNLRDFVINGLEIILTILFFTAKPQRAQRKI